MKLQSRILTGKSDSRWSTLNSVITAIVIPLILWVVAACVWRLPWIILVLYLVVVALNIATIIWNGTQKRKLNRRVAGLCVTCGYNLRGNVSGRCPECGTPTSTDIKTA